MAFDPVGCDQKSVTELVKHAIGHELDIAQGKDDQEKKRCVLRTLDQMDGQVFEFGGARVIVRRGFDTEGNSTFGLQWVSEVEKVDVDT